MIYNPKAMQRAIANDWLEALGLTKESIMAKKKRKGGKGC